MDHEPAKALVSTERQTPRILRILCGGIFLCACGLFWRLFLLSSAGNLWVGNLLQAYKRAFWL